MKGFKPYPHNPRYLVSKNGEVLGPMGRILTPGQDNRGALRVYLVYPDRHKEQTFVHRMVLETYIGDSPEGMECCHNDGNPANNRLKNLRWDTKHNNHLDRRNHGTAPIGANNANAVLTDDDIVSIRERRAAGQSQASLAREYSITPTQVCTICQGKQWKHVGGPLVSPKRYKRKDTSK